MSAFVRFKAYRSENHQNCKPFYFRIAPKSIHRPSRLFVKTFQRNVKVNGPGAIKTTLRKKSGRRSLRCRRWFDRLLPFRLAVIFFVVRRVVRVAGRPNGVGCPIAGPYSQNGFTCASGFLAPFFPSVALVLLLIEALCLRCFCAFWGGRLLLPAPPAVPLSSPPIFLLDPSFPLSYTLFLKIKFLSMIAFTQAVRNFHSALHTRP